MFACSPEIAPGALLRGVGLGEHAGAALQDRTHKRPFGRDCSRRKSSYSRRFGTQLAWPTARTSLVMTTNLPFESWPEVCGGERLTGAILNRLTHRVHILEANGESCRLRDSKRRLKGRKG